MIRWRSLVSATAIVVVGIGAGVPLASSGVAATSSTPPRSAVTAPVAVAHHALGLHVSGTRIRNAHGHAVRLLGFNNSGAEYACIEGWGMFDVQNGTNTSVPAAYVAAMARWQGANAVRLSLNEQCWLGIGGVKPQYGGANYQHAIERYVRQLNARGFAVILNLHNSAPGNESSLNQEEMPDAHSVTFWRSVAAAFTSNTSVVFDLFNEPWPDNQAVSNAAWRCWRNGGCRLPSQNGGATYTAVGMNQLIRAVRSSGARNIVLAGGLNFASSLTKWLRYKPIDPAHELAASLHVYSFGGCRSLNCYNGAPAHVARHVPLVIGEFGADLTADYATIASGCLPTYSGTTGFDATLLRWAKTHHVSWLAWTWNPWDNCMALVKDFAGHATTPYGRRVRHQLLANRQSHRA